MTQIYDKGKEPLILFDGVFKEYDGVEVLTNINLCIRKE